MRFGLWKWILWLSHPRWQRKIAKRPAARHAADWVIWDANVAAFPLRPAAAGDWWGWDGADVIVVVFAEELCVGVVFVIFGHFSYGAAGE